MLALGWEMGHLRVCRHAVMSAAEAVARQESHQAFSSPASIPSYAAM